MRSAGRGGGGCSCTITVIIGDVVEEPKSLEVSRRLNREPYDVPNGFVECRVRSVPEQVRLLRVLQVILNVGHLVVYGQEVLHCHFRALFDSSETKQPLFSWFFGGGKRLTEYVGWLGS